MSEHELAEAERYVARLRLDPDAIRALQPGDPDWNESLYRLGLAVWGAFNAEDFTGSPTSVEIELGERSNDGS